MFLKIFKYKIRSDIKLLDLLKFSFDVFTGHMILSTWDCTLPLLQYLIYNDEIGQLIFYILKWLTHIEMTDIAQRKSLAIVEHFFKWPVFERGILDEKWSRGKEQRRYRISLFWTSPLKDRSFFWILNSGCDLMVLIWWK